MNHGRSDELQREAAEVYGLVFRYDLHVRRVDSELLHKCHSMLGAEDSSLRILRQESADSAAVVGLHMLANEEIRCATIECLRHLI